MNIECSRLSTCRGASALMLVVAMVAALLGTLLHGPAAADDPTAPAGAFRGRMVVGAALAHPTLGTGRQTTWSLESDSTPAACVALGIGVGIDPSCSVNAAGRLGSSLPGVPGIGDGGYCGLSRGFGGEGSLRLSGAPDLELRALGWLTSAGTLLPATGRWEGPHGTGSIVLYLKLSGTTDDGTALGVACTNQTADSFDVSGIFALLPAHLSVLDHE